MEIETPRIDLKTIKRCPSCRSVFVTEAECESCGLQLKPNRLTEEISKRSFYNLQENFQSEMGPFYSRFLSFVSKDNSSFKQYRQNLSRRFSLLLKYFVSDERKGLIDSKKFLFEFRDLVQEMLRFDYSQNYIFDKIENLNDHPFRQELFMITSDIVNEGRQSESILDKKLFNLIRVRFILQAFAIYGALIFLAVLAFEKSYLN